MIEALWQAFSSVRWPVLLVILDALCILHIIFSQHRGNSGHRVAWVLAVLCFPVAGILLYLLLGRRAYPRHSGRFRLKRQIDGEMAAAFDGMQRSRLQGMEPACSMRARLFDDVVLINQNTAFSPLTRDNEVLLLPGAQQKFASLLKDIKNAKDHIHLLYFIYRDDGIGRQLTQALTEKARQGVQVRLLLDAWGSNHTRRRLFVPLVQAGARVCRYPRGLIQHLITVNFRNHRKIVVIDGRIGYVGGINVGDEYLGKDARYPAWRDTHVRVVGSAAHLLQLRFAKDWAYACGERLDPADPGRALRYFPPGKGEGNTDVQVVSSGPDSKGPSIKYGMIRLIDCARERVYIQTPYLIPDQSFLEALKMAAARGVDVRIMVPGTPDHWYIHYAGMSYVQGLLESGARIYRYHGMIHAKTIVADAQAATVGSTNICSRSFLLNDETNAFIYNEAFACSCERAFIRDIASCTEILPAAFSHRPAWHKAVESACRLASPLL